MTDERGRALVHRGHTLAVRHVFDGSMRGHVCWVDVLRRESTVFTVGVSVSVQQADTSGRPLNELLALAEREALTLARFFLDEGDYTEGDEPFFTLDLVDGRVGVTRTARGPE
jgi:hypothetical protein